MKIFVLLLFSFTIELAAQSWQVVGYMPYRLSGGEAVVQGNNIYILGGFSDSLGSNVNLIQAYNPQTNSWSIAGNMVYPRSNFVADNYSDSIVYFGGISQQSHNSGSLEVWNINSSPYVFKVDSDFDRSNATGHVVNGNLYIFGGLPSQSHGNYLFGYNIDSDKTIRTNDSVIAAQFPFDQMSAVIGDDIYIFGGTSLAPIRSIFDFNTNTNTLTVINAELENTRAGGAAVSSSDSVIYLIGGYDQINKALRSVSKIDLKRRDIEEEKAASLNFARKEPIAVNYQGSVYVFGGIDQNGQTVTAVEKLDLITGIQNLPTNLPKQFELENNYPNPFNPTTQISFKVGSTAKVSLDIYNILGAHVKNIVTRVFSPGEYRFTWNGTDDAGNTLPSGMYIYKLISNYFTDAKKMILLK